MKIDRINAVGGVHLTIMPHEGGILAAVRSDAGANATEIRVVLDEASCADLMEVLKALGEDLWGWNKNMWASDDD